MTPKQYNNKIDNIFILVDMQNISFVFLYFFGPVDFWFGPVKLQKIEFYWPNRASEKKRECRALQSNLSADEMESRQDKRHDHMPVTHS